ncbi:tetratricopeptide repeat protein [Candidatus Uabimicrobium sp. HlEnr_7]|uniref:tetratricopeptide repeat protein n=1 Tax=Candidatus Uabimicrobium helgolandensis TaxID=3095367 RepID=UPI0035574930
MTSLYDIFHEKKALVFCGAGVSLEPPAGLPDWHMLRDCTLASIANSHSFLQKYTKNLTEIEMISETNKKGLTPEYVASIILKYCDGYFESFQVLEEGEPNANHLYLAKLAKLGYLQYIVTTNFDIFIESALQENNIPYRVYSSDEDYSSFDSKDERIHLFKLHGCIRNPGTITTTVEQESQGLSISKTQVLQQLLAHYHFVFWGYSGADLKINLDYLCMETEVEKAKGFTWNFLQKGEWQEPVNSYVSELVKLYGEKAAITHGQLPEIFKDILPKEQQIEHIIYDKNEQRDLTMYKNEQLRTSLDNWANKHINVVNAFTIVGRLLRHSGQPEKAFECYKKLTQIADTQQHYSLIANAYNEMGYLQKMQSYYQQALEYFELACQIAEDNSDRKLQAEYLNSIGGIYRVRRDYQQAFAYYRKAVEIAESIEDNKGLAFYLNKLGGLYKSVGERKKALSFLQKAKDLCVEIGDQQGLAINLDNIGKLFRDEKRTKEALEYFLEAERITRSLGDKQGIAIRLSSLGGIYKQDKKPDESLDCYLKALEISEDLGDRRGSLLHAQNAASVYVIKKAYSQAAKYYQKAIKIAENLQDTRSMAKLCRVLGNVYNFDMRNFCSALIYYEKSIVYYRELNWQREISKIERSIKKMR